MKKDILLIILVSLFFPPIFYAAYLGPEFLEFVLTNVHIKIVVVLIVLEIVAQSLNFNVEGHLKYDLGTDLALKGFVANLFVVSAVFSMVKFTLRNIMKLKEK